MTDTTGLDANACAANAISDEEREIRKLRHEVEMLMGAGIIEVAVRNPNVAEYMKHWEDRALKAEAAVRTANSSGVKVKGLDAETIKARAASILCETGTLCGWPAPNCNAREGAEALFDAGLLREISTTECATEGCGKPATDYFERGGVGSHYCHDCYTRIQSLAPAEAGVEGDAKPVADDLAYGVKLIAEAIEYHFGDRDDAYRYEIGDTTIYDVWEAFDALTHPSLLEECREALAGEGVNEAACTCPSFQYCDGSCAPYLGGGVSDAMVEAALKVAWPDGEIIYDESFQSPNAQMHAALTAALLTKLEAGR